MKATVWMGALITAALFVPAAPVAAQNNATIVMKSGERKPAQNIGCRDCNELIVRTSFSEEPRIPIDQIAYIDFGGTSDVNPEISGSQQAAVLRDGTVLHGRVEEVGHANPSDHSTPLVVVFRMSSGERRELAAQQLSRIYFSQPGAGQAQQPGAVASGMADARTITVDARQAWTPALTQVRRGDRVRVAASGQIQLNGDGSEHASPDGNAAARIDPRSPLTAAPAGALIGRVGNGRPFAVGANTEVTMSDSGQLFFGVNDSNPTDNSGSFQVQFSRTPGSGR